MKSFTMTSLAFATLLVVGLAPAGWAQTQSPSPAKPPAASTSSDKAQSKFKAADKNNNGSLDGAELDAHKLVMAQVDTDKDGKISRSEFVAGVMAGHIK